MYITLHKNVLSFDFNSKDFIRIAKAAQEPPVISEMTKHFHHYSDPAELIAIDDLASMTEPGRPFTRLVFSRNTNRHERGYGRVRSGRP